MQLYYFISADGRRLGPVPGEELVNCGITPDTLVWGQNMSGWAPANTVPEIVALFTSQPQPTQPQPSEEAAEMPESSSTVGNAPIQTENDIDSPSTSAPQTPESPASELSNPSSEPKPNDKKSRGVWSAIVIIIAILILLCWVLFVKNSNSNPSAEAAAADSVLCVEEDVDFVVYADTIAPVVEVKVNGVTFNMIYVSGGTFTMGATSEQGSDYFDEERPTHQVTLSDFYIGKYEVTQQLWEYVMKYSGKAADGSTMSAYASDVWLGTNPSSAYGVGNYYPAYCVSWNDIVNIFIPRLNKITGKNFRLPTEAEWEFAARGGNYSRGYKYSGSNRIDDVAWYWGNSSSKTHQVGTKSPNELGIYDMSGNVYEWCSDWYGDYSSSSQTNPTGPVYGSYRVFRGGSWGYSARHCRVSYRGRNTPGSRGIDLGFRLVCSSL